MKKQKTKVEYRGAQSEMLVTEDNGDNKKLKGYAAVYNSESVDLGNFTEILEEGCFDESLLNSDMRALVDHDTSKLLGREQSGTLVVESDEYGLYVEIDPPSTSYGQDIVESVSRGDTSGMSIGFTVLRERWEGNTRYVEKAEIIEASVVSLPAYESTEVAFRAKAKQEGKKVPLMAYNRNNNKREEGLTNFPSYGQDEQIKIENSNYGQFNDEAAREMFEEDEIRMWMLAREQVEDEEVRLWILKREDLGKEFEKMEDFTLENIIEAARNGLVLPMGEEEMTLAMLEGKKEEEEASEKLEEEASEMPEKDVSSMVEEEDKKRRSRLEAKKRIRGLNMARLREVELLEKM